LIKVHGKPTGRFNQLTNLKLGRGKYIAFCDGDDYWNDLNKLQNQATLLENHSCFAIAYHDMRKVDENGKPLSGPVLGKRFCVNRTSKQVMAWRSPIHPSSAMVRRVNMKELPESFREVMCADLFMLGFVAQYGKAGVAPVLPGSYRIHAGGIFSKQKRLTRSKYALSTYQELTDCLKQPFRSAVGFRLCEFHNVVILDLLAAKSFGAAFGQASQMLKDVPRRIGWLFPLYQLRWLASFFKNRVRKTSESNDYRE
jgi:hypothetical protein